MTIKPGRRRPQRVLLLVAGLSPQDPILIPPLMDPRDQVWIGETHLFAQIYEVFRCKSTTSLCGLRGEEIPPQIVNVARLCGESKSVVGSYCRRSSNSPARCVGRSSNSPPRRSRNSPLQGGDPPTGLLDQLTASFVPQASEEHMARRTFDVIDIVEILVHWHAGRPNAVVAQSLGTDRKTIRKYVAPAEAAGLRPRRPAAVSGPVGRPGPGLVPRADRPAGPQPHPCGDRRPPGRIAEMLKTNTATTVHQRLRDEHGLDVGHLELPALRLAGVPRRGAGEQGDRARPDVPAGEEAQIDYGYLGRWFDPMTETLAAGVGLRHGAGHAAGTCSCARCLRMDQRAWVAAPRRGVRVLRRRAAAPGAATTSRPASIKPDIYDPKLNRAYGELAAALQLPRSTRLGPLKPKDKPRVERPMPYVRDSYFARPRVDRPPAHASGRADLVHRRRRSARAPIARRRLAARPSSKRSRHRR